MQCNTIKHKKHKNTTPCNDKTLHKLDPVDPYNWIFDRLAKHTSYVYCLRYTRGHHHQNHPDVIDLSSIESLEGEGGFSGKSLRIKLFTRIKMPLFLNLLVTLGK